VVDDLLPERLAGDVAGGEQVARLLQRARHVRLVRGVRVALERRLQLQLVVDPVQPGRDHRCDREVRVDVAAGEAALHPKGVPVPDHAHRARPVVTAPGDRGRRERALGEALVGVDVGRLEQGQLAQAGELPRDERVEQTRLLGEHRRAVLPAHGEVDVARVALTLVVLGHERDRHALLGGDLLGGVLVDRVRVGSGERALVGEVDLVLAEVALALGVLDREARAGHLAPDAADQRLHARRAEHGVVDVVEVRRLEAVVALVERLLVGVAKHDELELGRRERHPAALGEPVELAAQDLARGGDDGRVVVPLEVRHAHRGLLVPGHQPDRVEVRLHLEVAVAGLPRGHRVARDGVHVDVHGEQVVARLCAVLEHLLDEVVPDQALALEAALHVGEAEEDGVDRPLGNGLPELVDRHEASSASALAIASNSSSGADATR
jgi:hypothetical protein